MTILLADDQPLALQGLRALLIGHSEAIAVAPSAEETLGEISRLAPRLLIMGFFTDGAGRAGMDLLCRIAARPTPPRILVRAPGNDPHLRVGLARLGAAGLVDTAAPGEVFLDALERLLHGRTHFDPLPAHCGLLTGRQLAILQLVARGRPQKQVAAELGMADVTLHHHLAEARRRLQAPNTAALVAVLPERRILHLPPWTLEGQAGRRAGGQAGRRSKRNVVGRAESRVAIN